MAGTNGKGSVVAFMRAMLEAAGYRAHVYTSPHLVRFNERIRVAGEPISDAALEAVLEDCEAANGGDPITFFEITTAAAFLAFARTPADVALLETGLGGRLDATNVVEKPALTVLTPVSMDHQSYLGDTLDKVLAEKAGILKPGVPCLFASQERRAPRLLAERAKELDVPLVREGKDWHVRTAGDGIVFESEAHTRTLPAPALPGAHQVRNAGLAIACLDRLPGFTVPDAALGLGLKGVSWPGRLQRLTRGPLADRLPEGWELWVDGAHNPAAARVVAAHARRWRDRPLHLVVGMMSGKDPVAFLKPFEGKVASLHTVAVPGEPGTLNAEEVAGAGRALLMTADPTPGVTEAVDAAVAAAAGPARILICGSLYLVGSVLAENG